MLLCQSYNIGHTKRMLGVINTSGAVFTCSGDGTVKVLEPTRDPTVLASLKSHKNEVADVSVVINSCNVA